MFLTIKKYKEERKIDSVEFIRRYRSYSDQYKDIFGYVPCRSDYVCDREEYLDALLKAIESERELSTIIQKKDRNYILLTPELEEEKNKLNKKIEEYVEKELEKIFFQIFNCSYEDIVEEWLIYQALAVPIFFKILSKDEEKIGYLKCLVVSENRINTESVRLCCVDTDHSSNMLFANFNSDFQKMSRCSEKDKERLKVFLKKFIGELNV